MTAHALTIKEQLELAAKPPAWELRPGPDSIRYPPDLWAYVVFGRLRDGQAKEPRQ